ncbi:MAG: hypothetical protein O2780_08160 [Proteobacteria bacterium]|nr:hypothetical protein [Pseudomonadota bacterium]MDA1301796.1 hypothetical protein [Pseudomonadota bacterium]
MQDFEVVGDTDLHRGYASEMAVLRENASRCFEDDQRSYRGKALGNADRREDFSGSR